MQVRLLGTFEVYIEDELLDLHHRKADLLFACLAIYGNWMDRSLVQQMVFPEAESAASLDKAVGVLRKQLGQQQERLEVRMGRLRLNLKDAQCDLALFDRLIKQHTNVSALQQAISVYGGPLLPIFPIGEEEGPSPEFQQWLYKERSRRENLFRDGLERAIQLAREERRFEDALLLLRRYVQEYRKSERAWILYMRVTMECGDRLEGIFAYEQYRAALHVFALRPIAHVEELYCRLLTEGGEQGNGVSAQRDSSATGNQWLGGALRPDDPRYVTRPPDRLLEEAVRRSDTSIVLVKGPRETGKSSLVIRCLHQTRARGALTLLTDFKAFPLSAFESTESLCMAILLQVGEQLAQIHGNEVVTPEDETRVRKLPTIGLEQFVHRHLLNEQTETTILWAMDRVDRLFGTLCSADFFSLLRSWHDKRTQFKNQHWTRLKIVVVASTEATLFLRDINQSPFNVGLRIDISDFSRDEAQTLSHNLGDPLNPSQQEELYTLLAGHPGLTGQALHILNQGVRFPDFMERLDQEDGPFGEHLQRLWDFVCSRSEHRDAVRSVLAGKPCPAEPFLMLRSAGVLAGDASNTPRMRCPLYARFLHRKKP